MLKDFTIGCLRFQIAKSGSGVWFSNCKDSEFRIRTDHLISIHRIYARKTKQYVYRLVLFKYTVACIILKTP
jgi:hypothetical protein